MTTFERLLMECPHGGADVTNHRTRSVVHVTAAEGGGVMCLHSGHRLLKQTGIWRTLAQEAYDKERGR